MYKAIALSFLLVIGTRVHCQNSKNKIIGTYKDNISELTLKSDSTFELKTTDYVFPYTDTVYQNHGVWTKNENVVTLNPTKEKRRPYLSLTEKVIEKSDSIQIKINYFIEVYKNEIKGDKTPAEFNLITLYINKEKKYLNLVHSPILKRCAFSPRIKRQLVLDSTNRFKIRKQQIERLGIYTFGFDKKIELNSINPKANYFEITIVQPVDIERTPRSKKVVIKGNHVYYYEWYGKVLTSGLFLNGLKRVK